MAKQPVPTRGACFEEIAARIVRRKPHPFADQWDFFSRAVWTRDEASKRIRPFPAEFSYLEYLSRERRKHRVRLYEKSRRMFITWWMLSEYIYDLMIETNDLSAVASDKLQKSAYLLGGDRMELIYKLIPPVDKATENWLRNMGMSVEPFKSEVWPDKPPVIFEGKEGLGWKVARCEATNSQIMAVASGESQMQQYTFSKILMDEFPRWQWQEESWRNIQPATQGGGAVDIICTAELGAFAYDLAYDRVGA